MQLFDRRVLDVSITIQGIANEPAENPAVGTQYIVGETPTGAFASATANKIARFDGTKWRFTKPKAGRLEVINLETNEILKFNGTDWIKVASLGESGIAPVDMVVEFVGGNFFSNYGYLQYQGAHWIEYGSSYSEKPQFCEIDEDFQYGGLRYLAEGERYASRYDGKIYTCSGGTMVAEILSEGGMFYSKSDKTYYYYDATAGKFAKASKEVLAIPKVKFIVDIATTAPRNIPDSLDRSGNKILGLDTDSTLYVTHYYEERDSLYDNQVTFPYQTLTAGDYVATKGVIRYYSDNTAYLTGAKLLKCLGKNERNEFLGFEQSDITDGTFFVCEEDGCTYQYDAVNKTFVKAKNKDVITVSGIGKTMRADSVMPAPTKAGEKFLAIYGKTIPEDPNDSYGVSVTGYLFTATDSNTWDSGIPFAYNESFISTTDKKLYIGNGIDTYNTTYSGVPYYYSYTRTEEIPSGTIIFNKADDSFYRFDGTNFIKIGGENATEVEPIAPVIAIVPTGTTLPATATIGDKFLKIDDAKIYTATAADTWDAGVLTASGDRYASNTDFKIYQSDGSALTAEDVPTGGLFLNKSDNYIYVYDTTFIRASVDNAKIVETHTLTAAEATAKSFSLANNIKTGEETNIMLFVGGAPQIAAVDYTASGSTISWDSKGLDDIGLAEDDVFIIHYVKG